MKIDAIENTELEAAEQNSLYALSNVAANGVDISIESLSKSYADRDVLQSLNLQIAAGEFVAIVGRSGCGKSTLLRLIAGLETASTGEINFNRDPDIRIMFQDARLLPWKSVQHNVMLGVPTNSSSASNQIAHNALQQVGLASRAKEWPAVLSGGQAQRVALARALVHEPELLLLDEPLGALDALTRAEMQRLIETVWQARGFTAVLVTHDVQEAVALADRVLLIEDGEITLDERIALPRPRSRSNPVFAQLEEKILARVLRHTTYL
ncbi:ATP-binding cassette domain-containing protein [Glaciimonas soli]|uniref:ATP-binding cassette domain-containing protein n=1 Tax=Glaciimonas soli TaxID=2590999 RepID=A0A843YP69_9BURK|nr:ATP-binding cassette domain-containing protein [Glaciimonas soli]MQQ99573.1 ATP-binding cassette domain-containing protein [Glaciimonas soli]